MKLISLIVFAVLSVQAQYAASHGLDKGVNRNVLNSTSLQNIPGHSLTSVTVELQPGVSVPAHQHEGVVFVYVISGSVLSQLNQETPIVYQAGDSWVEKAGVQHSMTKNMSNTDSAELLAVFVAQEGAKLTKPDSFKQ